ncbi:MAG: hypothetical protein WB761_05330, partial [Solirubrobacteraceae bacterium]
WPRCSATLPADRGTRLQARGRRGLRALFHHPNPGHFSLAIPTRGEFTFTRPWCGQLLTRRAREC